MKTIRVDAHNLDSGRAQLRAVVATIDQELLILSREVMRDDPYARADGLRSSWSELVKLLALGPVPEVRECPVCCHSGMRDALRCGYCWTRLSPVAVSAPLLH